MAQPTFITPDVMKMLQDNYNLMPVMPVGDPAEDMRRCWKGTEPHH